MALTRKNISGLEFNKFIESYSRSGEPAIEVGDIKLQDLISDIIVILSESNAVFFDISDTTNPNIEKTVFSYLLINKLKLKRVNVSCRIESEWSIKLDGAVIGTLLTGASTPNASFVFSPKRELAAGSNFQLTIKSRANSPIVSCTGHIQCLE